MRIFANKFIMTCPKRTNGKHEIRPNHLHPALCRFGSGGPHPHSQTTFITMTNVTFPSGLYFTPKKQLVNTLFNPQGTASGFYQKRKNGILFSRPNGAPWFFLCANSPINPFYVSCSVDPKGRTRYMFALSSLDERDLAMASHSLSCQHALNTWESLA
jgi:hypothetical protein